MQKLIFSGAILLGLGMLVLPGSAQAWDPSIQSTTQCRASESADWIVTWTIVPGDYPGAVWEIISPSPSGYSPAGQQPAVNDFTKTVSYPASQLSASESVTVRFQNASNRIVSGSIDRPPVCSTPVTDPPATDPPATDPPATDPPATDPPATDPPATDPPATDPPATDPPATDPPATDPPLTTEPGSPTTTTTTTDPPLTTDPASPTTTTTEPPLVTDPASPTTDAPDTTPGPTDNSESGDTPTTTPSDPDSPDDGGPDLPATGRDATKDMLTAALILFGFGGLTISAARGRRSELLDS